MRIAWTPGTGLYGGQWQEPLSQRYGGDPGGPFSGAAERRAVVYRRHDRHERAHPFGDPSRTLEGEKEWRLRVVRAALAALQTPVQQPTVFDVEDIVVR